MAKTWIFCLLLVAYASADSSSTIQPSSSIQDGSSLSATISASIQASPSQSQIQPSSSQAPVVNLVFGSATNEDFKISLVLTLNETWNANLNQTSTPERTALVNRVKNAIGNYFVNSTYFNTANVTNIQEESVNMIKVHSIIYMTTDGINENETQTTFQPIMQALSMKMMSGFGDLILVPYTAMVSPIIDGKWNSWIDGACTNNIITSTRNCTGPFNGGIACQGSTTKTTSCVTPSSGANAFVPVALFSIFMASLATKLGM